jgi:hypothetical protein
MRFAGVEVQTRLLGRSRPVEEVAEHLLDLGQVVGGVGSEAGLEEERLGGVEC